MPVRNSAGKIAPGIDVRGDGGYVLAPPSIHPTGRRYEWSVDCASALATAPAWLLDRVFIGDRLDPPPRGTMVRFDLPRIQSAKAVPNVIDAILQACAGGKLTTTEASDLVNVISRLQSAVTFVELEQRIRQIETGMALPLRLAAVR